jgi:hypothetical protein
MVRAVRPARGDRRRIEIVTAALADFTLQIAIHDIPPLALHSQRYKSARDVVAAWANWWSEGPEFAAACRPTSVANEDFDRW